MGTGADIELLFGVLGGGSVSGASGRKIQSQLNNIVGNINRAPMGIKLSLNKNSEDLLKQSISRAISSADITHFNSAGAIAKLRADVQAALSGLVIPASATVPGATGNQAATNPTGMSVDEITKLNDALKSLNTRLLNTSKRAQETTNSLSGLNAGSTSAASGSRATATAVASTQQIATLTRRAETLLRNNPRIINTGYEANINSVLSTLQSGNIDVNKFKRLREEIAGIEVGLKKAGLQGKTLWSTLKSGYAKFGGWALITRSMMAAANAVRNMINNVTQLDAAMVELRKVTDETDDTYEKFFSDATVRARNLGATVVETINASADFARLGYSIEDASTLADVAIMYKNVGDGISDIGVASQSIISTLKGFSLEAEDATHIVDAFNEVGNNFAISSAGIGDALTRSAASLSAANNTMEESIALITAMNTTLQDPEKVGKHLCPAA